MIITQRYKLQYIHACKKYVVFQICIHRMLQDVHVIRFYGQRSEGSKQYLFLEYAAGGELFDRIGKAMECVGHQ